jgi:hypothetical protein
MRNFRAAHLGSAIALSVLALGGCSRTNDGAIGRTHTTGTVVLTERGMASPSAALPEVPDVSTGPEIRGEFRRVPSPPITARAIEKSGQGIPVDETQPAEDVDLRLPEYERPPRYEPNGGMVSDVGMPYPLPDLPTGVRSVPPPRPATELVPPPFVETSFGPDKPSPRFVESSFGPDAGG